VHWGFEVIRFTAIIKSIKFSKLITVLRATEASGVISIVEVIREGYKEISVQGSHILKRTIGNYAS
jgi:hypothetical protein